jgi:endonuclease V-like protein UPF0215 family
MLDAATAPISMTRWPWRGESPVVSKSRTTCLVSGFTGIPMVMALSRKPMRGRMKKNNNHSFWNPFKNSETVRQNLYFPLISIDGMDATTI